MSAAILATGVGLGVVHVLTGPDHLSALATLSSVSDLSTSFWLGVRWGLGHSTGLLLVGTILILRDVSFGSDETAIIDMPDKWSHFFESLVGVFMIALGLYGFQRAWRMKRQQGRQPLNQNEPTNPHHYHHHQHTSIASNIESINSGEEDTGDSFDDEWDTEAAKKESQKVASPMVSYHDDPHPDQQAQLDALERMIRTLDAQPELATALEVDQLGNRLPHGSLSSSSSFPTSSSSNCLFELIQASRQWSVRTLAVMAGVVHGLAGPGGVLGVIPAVQLHDWKLATLYLASFCVSSTLTMGFFASLYGLLSSQVGHHGNWEFPMHCFSSILSLLVGITWLVLLSLGKLEDVFP